MARSSATQHMSFESTTRRQVRAPPRCLIGLRPTVGGGVGDSGEEGRGDRIEGADLRRQQTCSAEQLNVYVQLTGSRRHCRCAPAGFLHTGAQDFVRLLGRHPLLVAKVPVAMARQMFRLEETVESLVLDSVGQRLARLLLGWRGVAGARR